MKKISAFLAAALLIPGLTASAQDAALMERLNKLSGQIEDLIAAKEVQNKKIDELAKALETVQQQQSKPNVSYASQEDLKALKESLLEVDRKRKADYEHVAKELENLARTLRVPANRPPPAASGDGSGTGVRAQDGSGGATPARPEKGYEYVVKADDTISAIAKAYNDQGIKVTVKQILDANPKVKPETLKPGQKIFIPASAQ